MKNKLFAVALILSMVFTLSACGGSGSSGQGSGSGIEWELTEDGYEADYDFGGDASGLDEGALGGTLAKLDYSDLDKLQEPLQTAAEEGMEAAGIENFQFLTDFEEMEESVEEAKEEGYEVGDLVYCSGMEDDDMDLAAFESGVYNNPMDGKYYQYSIFSTKSYYGADNVDADEVLDTIKTTYGITLDKDKLEKAISAIETKAMEPIPEDESADAEEGEEGEEGEDADAEDLDEEDMVFVDEDGNEISLEDQELEEEDLSEDEEASDEESADAEEDLDESEDEYDEEFEESEGEEDGDFQELTEDEMNDLVFADEDDFEGGYPCMINQKIDQEGDGYTDHIILSLIAQQVSEEEVVIYMSVEIDRCYAEQ